MDMRKLMPILKKYEKCPKCGNEMIGNGQGGIQIEEEFYKRTCKCGFKVVVNEDGKEISEGELIYGNR